MFANVVNRFSFDVHNMTSWALAGTSITPGNNTFPTYAEILSDTVVTQDCYYVEVAVSHGAVGGSAKDTLLNIGADPAGGTSFTTIIPNLYVCNSNYASIPIIYRFPLFIKSGTALAAQASCNNATPGTLRCMVRLWGAPSHPEVVKCGSYVDSFGAVTATSTGTAVTAGASSAEAAAWVQLGSNTTRDYWHWQTGLGINSATVTGGVAMVDLAAGTSISANDVIVKDDFWSSNSVENFFRLCWLPDSAYAADVGSGKGIYGRASWSGVADATLLTAYGLGG